mgnify:CR=1 FL=1
MFNCASFFPNLLFVRKMLVERQGKPQWRAISTATKVKHSNSAFFIYQFFSDSSRTTTIPDCGFFRLQSGMCRLALVAVRPRQERNHHKHGTRFDDLIHQKCLRVFDCVLTTFAVLLIQLPHSLFDAAGTVDCAEQLRPAAETRRSATVSAKFPF